METTAIPLFQETVEELRRLPAEKLPWVLDCVRSLNDQDEDEEPDVVDVNEEIKEALRQVALHRQGKIQLKTAEELIQELRNSDD